MASGSDSATTNLAAHSAIKVIVLLVLWKLSPNILTLSPFGAPQIALVRCRNTSR